MTNIEVTNGATVNRLHSDGSGEFVACFQSETDALEFAERRAAADAARDWLDSIYIVSCHRSGSIQALRPNVYDSPTKAVDSGDVMEPSK